MILAVALELLVLLVASLYLIGSVTRSLPEGRGVVAQGARFILIYYSIQIVLLRRGLRARSAYGAVAQIVGLVLVVFSVHLHYNIISAGGNGRSVGGGDPALRTLVAHVYALGIVLVVVARRPLIADAARYLLLARRRRVVIEALVHRVQIDLISVILRDGVARLARVECLREVARHKVVHHAELAARVVLRVVIEFVALLLTD